MKELMTQTKKRTRRLSGSLLIIVVLAVYSSWALARPLNVITPVSNRLQVQGASTLGPLSWPAKGQAAVGITPSGVLATHGQQKPVPTASVAKVITALMVLKKRPLAPGQTGPTITISEADVELYRNYVAGDGTVLPVEEGMKLTQYQMLQAILLPSANNIADTLVIWAFGSLENYTQFANSYTRQLGLTNTVVGSDASGYDPSTRSTAHNLVLIGQAAMQEPVIEEIVAQESAVIPGAGRIVNRNFLLGPDALAGIKTGTTEEAGGVFLAAKKVVIEGKPLTIVSAIAGTDTSYDAVIASVPLIDSVSKNFATTTLLPANAIVGRYETRWGDSVTAVTTKPLTALGWKGAKLPTEVTLQPASVTGGASQTVGEVEVPESPVSASASVPVKLSGPFSKPSIFWRLTHPF